MTQIFLHHFYNPSLLVLCLWFLQAHIKHQVINFADLLANSDPMDATDVWLIIILNTSTCQIMPGNEVPVNDINMGQEW